MISQGYPLWFAVAAGDIGMVVGWVAASRRNDSGVDEMFPVVAWFGEGGECWIVERAAEVGGRFFTAVSDARKYAAS